MVGKVTGEGVQLAERPAKMEGERGAILEDNAVSAGVDLARAGVVVRRSGRLAEVQDRMVVAREQEATVPARSATEVQKVGRDLACERGKGTKVKAYTTGHRLRLSSKHVCVCGFESV